MTYYFRSALFVLFWGTSIQPLFAQSLAQNSFTDALQYTNDNIVGTDTLLEATT